MDAPSLFLSYNSTDREWVTTLQKLAEFRSLTVIEQAKARSLFRRLVRVAWPEGAGEYVGQPADLGDADTLMLYVANRFANARLIVAGGGANERVHSVEVAHEALIRSWDRLRLWISEDREFLIWRQRLGAAIADWKRTNHDQGALLRGALLAEAERWQQMRMDELRTEETEFVEYSRRCQDQEDLRWRELDVLAEVARSAAQSAQSESRSSAAPATPKLPATQRILRIVVVSPSDVQAERNILPNIVDELNGGFGGAVGLRLEMSRWETDAYPGFHLGGPQSLIDEVLKLEDCDLVIGIFWRRFGTPVKDAQSGTEHEIRVAWEAWKKRGRPQIMVYFNQQPFAPSSKEEVDQWGRVLEFRSQFPAEGLWWTYRSRPQFEKLLRQHLTQFVKRTAQSAGGALDPSRLSE